MGRVSAKSARQQAAKANEEKRLGEDESSRSEEEDDEEFGPGEGEHDRGRSRKRKSPRLANKSASKLNSNEQRILIGEGGG